MSVSGLSLKRLFQKAGIYRVSNNSNNKLLNILDNIINELVDKSSAFSKKNVINHESVQKGYLVNNILDIITNQNGGEDYCGGEPSQCGGALPSYCHGTVSQCSIFSDEVIQQCAEEQQTGGSDHYFSIPKTQFSRMVEGKLGEFYITKSGLNTMQMYVEKSIINYLANKKNNEKIFKL